MSRGNSFLLTTVLVAAMFSMVACSSPEKDGIKAAKKRYDFENDYYQKRNEIENKIKKETNKTCESYIANFNSYSFTTRVEAREKLNENLEGSLEKLVESAQKLESDYQEWRRKASEYREKLESKYSTNREKQEKFNYAFNNYSPKERTYKESQEVLIDHGSKIRELIQSIIPPKPDIERLKNDLIGRSVTNQTTGYSNWIINSLDDLNGLEVLNTTDKDKEIFFATQLNLQKNNQWDVRINATYTLPDNEDWWRLVAHSNMNIVSTNKYNGCIKTQWTGTGGYGIPARHVEFTNSCDVNLIVTGELERHAGYTSNTKDRFQILIPANAKRTLNHSTINSSRVLYVVKFEIDFVEQSGL